MRKLTLALLLLGIGSLSGCKRSPPEAPEHAPKQAVEQAAVAPEPSETVSPSAMARFKPLPARFDLPTGAPSEALIALGRELYFEARLEPKGAVSCNSCHNLQTFGADGKKTTDLPKDSVAGRNAPSLYNVGALGSFGWDGAKDTLEEYIRIHLDKLVAKPGVLLASLKGNDAVVRRFKAAFPDAESSVTEGNVVQALGAFVRGLTTPSRFDQLLRGDLNALTNLEKKGLNAFEKVGCIGCHEGVGIGGIRVERLGKKRPCSPVDDQGRFAVTKVETDKCFFRVPSLRNVEKTSPYFHDGSIADLGGTVENMAYMQLSTLLGDNDLAAIMAFLKTFTGTSDAKYIAAPSGR